MVGFWLGDKQVSHSSLLSEKYTLLVRISHVHPSSPSMEDNLKACALNCVLDRVESIQSMAMFTWKSFVLIGNNDVRTDGTLFCSTS